MVDADVPTLLDQAVREYLDRLAEQKIIAESKAFRAMHAELLQQYRGEYVAVHDGKVVDHDEDICALNRRIRARYGHRAVLLQQVTERPEIELVIKSPKLEPIALEFPFNRNLLNRLLVDGPDQVTQVQG